MKFDHEVQVMWTKVANNIAVQQISIRKQQGVL